MNKIPVVISEKKRISKISDRILSLYQKLEKYFMNESVDFPSKISQKIILYYIYHCLCLKNKTKVHKFNFSDVLNEKVCSIYLGITKLIEDYNLLWDVYSEIMKIVSEKDFEEIVYYVLEVFEYVDVNKDDKKKDMGIYYTPDDVVKYMVNTTIRTYFDRRKYDLKNIQEKTEILNQLKIADLACGTGIFLIYAVRFILPYYINLKFSPEDAINEILSKNIWGIDISEKAVETTKILLLLDNRDYTDDFWELYKKVSFNIKRGNSISDETFKTIEMIFPELHQNIKFSCIIGNPPYSYRNGQQGNVKEYVSYTNSNSDKMYIYFVENMIRLSDKESVSSMIIPLAIAYNTSLPFRKIRNYISEDDADWKFAFFDRSPDSIFGDDVKTRISIIFRESSKEEHQVYTHTTGLIRWNSQNRDKLFENIKFCKVGNRKIEEYIFKTGNTEAEKAYCVLKNHKQTFISKIGRGENIIYYYPTAYNWLSFFQQEPLRKNKEGTAVPSNAKKMHITDDKNLVYALLCSTITYWLWVGTGDIFHVSTAFIETLPYNTEIIQREQRKELIKLGEQLWERVQDYKIYSNNAGIITMNFAYICCFDIIDRINRIIANIYHLSDDFVEFLKEWYLNLVCAGRSEFKYQEILTTFKENKKCLMKI